MSHSEKPDTDTSVEAVVDDSAENESVEEQVAGKDIVEDQSPEAEQEQEQDQKEEQEPEEEQEADVESVPTVEELLNRLEQANEQLTSFGDQTLRAQAEVQNIRKRAQRDVESAHKYGLEKFLTSLLPVIDSLEKAIESASQTEDDNTTVTEGVELCLKMMLDVLAKENVEQIFPEGEPFDPNFHEAMSVMENPDVEPNSVIDVFQKGYTLNGRLIRPAMVIVSKPSE